VPDLIPAGASASKRIERPEQSQSSGEQDYVRVPIKRPVELPGAALRTFGENSLVLSRLKQSERTPDQLPAAIGSSHQRFTWLVRPKSTLLCYPSYRPRIRGRGESAHDLQVSTTCFNGYRNIRLVSATAINVITADFRFDGQQYRLRRAPPKPIT